MLGKKKSSAALPPPTLKVNSGTAVVEALKPMTERNALVTLTRVITEFYGTDLERGSSELLEFAASGTQDKRLSSLLLRTIPKLRDNRVDYCSAVLRSSSLDLEFRQLIDEADKCRDVSRWNDAEFLYYRALTLYPDHSGYRVQYAHMLKEQGKFVEAEIEYRSALATGAPLEDVAEHIAFVAERTGTGLSNTELEKQYKDFYTNKRRPSLSFPPTKGDVLRLLIIFLQRSPNGSPEIHQILRRCATRAKVIEELVRHDDFRKRHRDLMTVISETR